MNRLHIFSLFLILSFNVLIVEAQDGPKKNWKKLVKDAEEYEKLGDIFRSAQNYEEAFSLKKDKKELSYKAGKNYMESRHYAKAVKCLEPVQNDNNVSAFNKPGFTYASALKQSGQFAEARIAFESFISTYEGSDKEKMREMAENEILGCTYALRGTEITNQDISVQLLDFNVNTDRTEFAPIPFTDNVLYFSSTVSGVSKIYRTQKNRQGTWMTRQVPTIFTGKMVKPHFGNGSFTPDGKRFFFTQCDLIVGGKPMCEIYLMYEERGNWSEPIRLPDEINLKGVNTTHPQVVIIEDKEVLYFASDREGGVGGMDIWYSSRNLTDGGTDFTIPKNLGQNVNTPGEEVSPHYNYPNKTLFFSSNGKVSTGGYDVYKSVGEKMEWAQAVNIGFPLNSSADDLFFVVSESHGGGYLISNRLSGKEKQSTINDDIFYYAEIKRQLLVKGAVFSEKDPTKTPLKDINVKFYEWDGSNKKIVHELNLPLANEYKVILSPDKEFKMEVIGQGYQLYSADISTKGVKTTETRIKDIALKMAEEEPVVMVPANTSKDNPFVVELGCNDGIMLKNFAERGIRHLGIEPSLNVAQVANKYGVRTRSEFFSEELAESIVREEGQADAFLAANVMCHIPDIIGVVKGIKKLIKSTGVVMFEDPYLGDVLAKTSYDQIYDEHVFLFSALSIQYLFGMQGMELIDVLPQKVHGGSMRYVLAHQGAYSIKDSVTQILAKERAQGLNRLVTFETFRASVEKSRLNLVSLLKELKTQGKKVAGYAATSKSTTILNYCGIGPDLIEYICDTTPIKQDKLSPGMHIHIVPYEAFKNNPPDYALLLAWNHADEIMEKEKEYLAAGGKWIVHVPEVKVLG